MSSTEIATPQAEGLIERIGSKLRTGIRTIQYARMVQVLSGFSDEQLNNLGLSRTDIPTRAQRCIYGAED